MESPVNSSVSIPRFALYGETDFSHTPEFAHIEDIHERSSRNGWLIRPHRHSHLFQILCIYSGEAEIRLDEQESRHAGAAVVVMPSGVVHGFRFDPSTRGVVLSLAMNMLGMDAENQLTSLLQGILSHPSLIPFAADEGEFRILQQYLETLRLELQTPRQEQEAALFALVKLILVTLKRRVQHEHHDGGVSDNGARLTARFRSLVEAHYREHWKIADYADALHVSVSTLNRACRQVLGNPAKKLLMERLHVEAKRRLLYTRETLDRISFHLGYKDTAYFSRVFKLMEGLSPKQFRQAVSERD